MYFFRSCLLIILLSLPFAASCLAEQEQDEPTNESSPSTEQTQSSNEASSKASDKWPQAPSQTQLLTQDLTQIYLPEQTIELDPDKQITVVVHQAQHSPTLGYVLILPQWDSPPFDTRKTHIQRELTRQGWHVLTLLAQTQLYLNGTPEEKVEQFNQYLKQTAERIATLTQLPETQAGYAIVLAEQNMAAIMLAIYNQQLSPLPNAMVLLGANKLSPQDNQTLANDLSTINLPILDIYQVSSQQVSMLQEVRAQAAQKNSQQDFRQLALDSQFIDENLGKYINGWARSLGLQ